MVLANSVKHKNQEFVKSASLISVASTFCDQGCDKCILASQMG